MKKLIICIIIILLILLLTFVTLDCFTLINTDNSSRNNMGENNYSKNEISNNNISNEILNSNNSIDNTITQENNNETLEENYTQDLYKGVFELPINGSTGYASVSLPLYSKKPTLDTLETSSKENIITNIKPGKAFKIIEESSDFFLVELSNSKKGWIESKYCLVNLPDLIPSIIYDDTNSYKSIFRSSGYSLENITGKALYNVNLFNNRFNEQQYIMPLLYPMVEKIAQIQKEALKNGDTLKIYETFRPYEVQMKVSDALSKLMESNETVNNGITKAPWSKNWFIATTLSNHQRGIALDVSLAKVVNKDYKYCGSYAYLVVSEYEEYKMPTKMHELSRAAATFTVPVNSKSKTDWKKVKLASTMTDGAIKLQNYFTSFGLTPLASEWWHFNDLDTRELTKSHGSNGKYYLTECLSEIPNK